MSSINIYNLVRALTRPYVGATFIYKDKHIKVWKARDCHSQGDINDIEPGKVLKIDDFEIFIKTGDGVISLIDYDAELSLNVGDYL